MAVYAPGDNPPPNIDPGMWARLMGYAGGFNPIGSAQAAPAPAPGPRPFQGPGTAGQSGGWPVNAAGQPQYALPHVREALAGGAGDTNTPAILPHLTGDGPNVPGRPILPYTNPNTREIANAADIPTNLPPAASGRGGGIGSDANFPVLGAGGFPTTYAPPGQQPPMPTPIPPGASPSTTVASAPRPAAIDPRMTGVVPPNATAQAPSNPFATLDYRPNANPGIGGGMLGGALASPRGQGGPNVSTALDLSGLFGGGRPAAAAPASSTLPKKKINVGKIPPDMRAEVPPDATSKAPSDYGPLQRNRRWKLKGDPALYS